MFFCLQTMFKIIINEDMQGLNTAKYLRWSFQWLTIFAKRQGFEYATDMHKISSLCSSFT